jgi:predicted Fe-Mo cluster-binding NifX family protein
VKIAIPRMGETVAPCFEYCATMAIFTVADHGDVQQRGDDRQRRGAPVLLSQVDFPLQSREPFDRVRLLRDQKVDTVICGGMQSFYEDVLRASGFEVISWVSGLVEDLLALYLKGALVPGTELPGDCGPDLYSMDRKTEH